MDESTYTLREFRDADYDAFARVGTRVYPDHPRSGEYLRDRDRGFHRSSMVLRQFVVEERVSGAPVGFGTFASPLYTVEPGVFWVHILVDPAREGRGIGRHLAERLEQEATAHDATTLRVELRTQPPRGMAFLSRQGYAVRRRQWESRQDVREVDLAPLPDRTAELARDGITITTLAEQGPARPEVREEVYRLNILLAADLPQLGVYQAPAFAEYQALTFEGNGFLPEAFFLARHGDRYVGLSSLERVLDEPKMLHQIFTGTLREYRRRGVATELKRRGVGYARSHGYETIRTNNDSLNQPMWNINRRLGYHREVESVLAEKRLLPTARSGTA